jgi:ribosomal protein L7Ae-like RNA K-turn-binding protein
VNHLISNHLEAKVIEFLNQSPSTLVIGFKQVEQKLKEKEATLIIVSRSMDPEFSHKIQPLGHRPIVFALGRRQLAELLFKNPAVGVSCVGFWSCESVPVVQDILMERQILNQAWRSSFGPWPNRINPRNECPTWLAAYYGFWDPELYIHFNEVDSVNGYTPLMIAIQQGHGKAFLVMLLSLSVSSLNQRSFTGCTAFLMSIVNQNKDAFFAILDFLNQLPTASCDALFNTPDFSHRLPLMELLNQNSVDSFTALLSVARSLHIYLKLPTQGWESPALNDPFYVRQLLDFYRLFPIQQHALLQCDELKGTLLSLFIKTMSFECAICLLGELERLFQDQEKWVIQYLSFASLDGHGCLWWACFYGQVELCRKLRSLKCPIEESCEDAVGLGNVDVRQDSSLMAEFSLLLNKLGQS